MINEQLVIRFTIRVRLTMLIKPLIIIDQVEFNETFNSYLCSEIATFILNHVRISKDILAIFSFFLDRKHLHSNFD